MVRYLDSSKFIRERPLADTDFSQWNQPDGQEFAVNLGIADPKQKEDAVKAESSDRLLPGCSVVICTRMRPALLSTCLRAVAAQNYANFEVIVVDNEPSPATRAISEQWNVRYIEEPVPGLSRARNRGAAAARHEIVAYLDDDSLPEAQWLRSLMEPFENRNVAAVAGQTLMPIVNQNGKGRPMEFVAMGPKRQRIVDQRTDDWFSIANFGGLGSGMNMAFRREVWQTWPGFDERLGRGTILDGGEEHYAFFSLIDRGYCVAYAPNAVVVHPSDSRTIEDVRSRFLKDCRAAGGYLLFLLFEQPRYWRNLLYFASTSLLLRRRGWREVEPSNQELAPRWRIMLARLSGITLYLRSLFQRRSQP